MPILFSSPGTLAGSPTFREVTPIKRSLAIEEDRDRGPLAGERRECLALAGGFAAPQRLLVQRIEKMIDEQLGPLGVAIDQCRNRSSPFGVLSMNRGELLVVRYSA